MDNLNITDTTRTFYHNLHITDMADILSQTTYYGHDLGILSQPPYYGRSLHSATYQLGFPFKWQPSPTVTGILSGFFLHNPALKRYTTSAYRTHISTIRTAKDNFGFKAVFSTKCKSISFSQRSGRTLATLAKESEAGGHVGIVF